MEEYLKFILSALGGASAVAVPLWLKIRKGQQSLRKGDVDVQTKEHKLKVASQIDSEAEWKRIIEYRDAELVRLRDRDEQQEKKLTDLYDKHLMCQRNEAAQAERIKMLEQKQDQADIERISAVKEIGELRALVMHLQTQVKEKGT